MGKALTDGEKRFAERLYREWEASLIQNRQGFKISPVVEEAGNRYQLIQQNPHSRSMNAAKYNDLVKKGHTVVKVLRNEVYIGVFIDGKMERF